MHAPTAIYALKSVLDLYENDREWVVGNFSITGPDGVRGHCILGALIAVSEGDVDSFYSRVYPGWIKNDKISDAIKALYHCADISELERTTHEDQQRAAIVARYNNDQPNYEAVKLWINKTIKWLEQDVNTGRYKWDSTLDSAT